MRNILFIIKAVKKHPEMFGDEEREQI